MHRAMTFLLALALLATSVASHTRLAGTANAASPSGGITIQDVPTPLVPSDVAGFTLASPKLFWYNGVPACPPRLVANGAGIQPAATYTQSISRIPAHGGLRRDLYQGGEECDGGKITSNIVADADYLYWLAPTGLVRLSTSANPGDTYQLVNALVHPYGQVADGGDKTFYLSPSGPNTEIGYVLKSNNQRVNLTTVGGTAGNLQFDGGYVYYVLSGTLYRLNPGVDVGISLASGVSGYYAEGQRVFFGGQFLIITNYVYIGQGRNVRIYNNRTNALGANPIYTSSDTTANVYNMTSDGSNLFVFESEVLPCAPQPCFASYNYVLFRMSRGGASPVPIYTYPSFFAGTSGLTTDGTFLYWQESSAVQRLPNNASALPQINMFITGMEITQGIQNLSNGVPLIQNRRTFVRVYVKSAGASVPGVTAYLTNNLNSGVLQPVNPVGTTITVRANPDRNDINQSFLFELPWGWTTSGPIQLTATLNPTKYPLEPNYADNVSTTSALTFVPSPSLSVQFFRLNYKIGGNTYSPSITNDVLKTYSWIMRAYPDRRRDWAKLQAHALGCGRRYQARQLGQPQQRRLHTRSRSAIRSGLVRQLLHQWLAQVLSRSRVGAEHHRILLRHDHGYVEQLPAWSGDLRQNLGWAGRQAGAVLRPWPGLGYRWHLCRLVRRPRNRSLAGPRAPERRIG